MDLRLSIDEENALREAQTALLSVLSHASREDWLREVTLRMKACLGADKGFILIDPEHEQALFTEGLTRDEVLTYPREVAGLDRRFGLWQRQLALAVWDRNTLNRPHMGAYLKSAYYNEYVVPVGAHDAMGVTVRTGFGHPIATAMFHHDRMGGRQFGERGLRILRLLEPCFRAGISTYVMHRRARAVLARAVDTINSGVVIYDSRCAVLHCNPIARDLFGADGHGLQLREQAAQLARVALHPMRRITALPRRAVTTRDGIYVMTATSLMGLSIDASVMVSIEGSLTSHPLSESEARSIGLTARQGEVASLLVDGLTDRQIAERLDISVHTAKRHVEAVLGRLAVSSRRDVSRAINDQLDKQTPI